MATPISHAVAALGIGSCFYKPAIPKRIWVAGALCSVIPDLDTIGFRFGVHYGDFLGHRGFTHSLCFAALLATLVTFLFRNTNGISRASLFLYLLAATASHGLLDAMTNGGLGIAFFSPFDTHRYFLPWRPIRVSPIGVSRLVSTQGLEIMRTELVWIWLPAIVLGAAVLVVRWKLGAWGTTIGTAGAGNRT